MSTSRQPRKELIHEIEKKRSSKVIALITSDRQGISGHIEEEVVAVIHEHILAIDPDNRDKLDLLIYSRGGDSDVPWSIISMLREYCQEGSLGVLIPYKAHSAATIMSLGADSIVMTKKAELGPIDITIRSGPYNPTEGETSQRLPISVEDVTGFFSLLDKVGCERPREKMDGFARLCEEVHPLALGNVSRLLQQTELVALRMLSSRSNAFSEERNREIVKRLSSEIFSHRHTISRTEALELGLRQVRKAEEESISKELWTLYEKYKDLFKLVDPFKPEQFLIFNDVEGHEWKDLNLICVETTERVDRKVANVKIQKRRQNPPNVNLNFNNLNFPPISIGNLPQGITPQQVQQIVQQLLPGVIEPAINKAVDQAVDQFVKSMPIAGFQRYTAHYVTKKFEGLESRRTHNRNWSFFSAKFNITICNRSSP